MTTPQLLMLGLVLLAGVPGAVLNRTSAALVLSYGLGWLTEHLTHASFDELVRVFVVLDATVVLFVYSKTEWCFTRYRSLGHQLSCLWWERSPWDRAVLLLFLMTWLCCAHVLDDYYRWWGLWWASALQFLAAAGEAAHVATARHRASVSRTDRARCLPLERVLPVRERAGYG